jgi:hypothetical protein
LGIFVIPLLFVVFQSVRERAGRSTPANRDGPKTGSP